MVAPADARASDMLQNRERPDPGFNIEWMIPSVPLGGTRRIAVRESVPGADRGPRAGNPRGVVDATG